MNIRQRFRQSLKCGTGEAYLIIRDNQHLDFSRDITKAALTNYAYDPQCEGDRAFYISQLIELSDKKEHIVEAIIKALGKSKEEDWAIDQLFGLAKIFAQQGNMKAKRAIYKRFSKITIDCISCPGQEEIIELDGIDGLKYVAEIRGKALTKNPNDWEDSFIVDDFQEENPKIKVYEELRKGAKGNPFIKKYLDTIKKNKWLRSKKRKKTKFNYEFIKCRIETNQIGYIPSTRVKEISKTDINKLANDFTQEETPNKQELYLAFFSNVKFPFDYRLILNIAKGKNSRNNRLVRFACRALRFFEAKDIRQFAIEKLSKTNVPSDYLSLLVANYKKGDHNLLAKIADRYKNENIIHDLVWAYIDIYKANKTKQCKRPLEIIYRKLTCSLHRYDIVKILYENGVLSKKLLKELEFDSNEEIRNFYKKVAN